MSLRALLRLAAASALAAVPALGADVQRRTADAVSFWLVEDAERELGAALETAFGELGIDPAAAGWRMAIAEAGTEPARFLDPLARILRLSDLGGGWGCQRESMELPDWPHVNEGPWEFGRVASVLVHCGDDERRCFDLLFVPGDVKGTLYGVAVKRMDEAEAALYRRSARPIPERCVIT